MNDRTIGQWALRRIRKHTAQPLLAFVALNALFMSHDVIAQSSDRSGKDVVESVCIRCHGTGEQGAPKIGDTKAWSARASQGLTSLTQHALDGIRQMPPHGGSPDVTDIEIMRAITYMVNESGGHWVQPLSPKDMGAERSGREIVAAQCAKCHRTGEGGAPKIGDQSAWIPRMKNGIDYLVRSAIKGHGPMPSRGGLADTTDAEIRNAILYMFNPQIAVQSGSGQPGGAPRAQVATPARPVGEHQTVGGMDIYLGLLPAEALRAYPKESVEGSMHGGVPPGGGSYHLNVSLFDAKSGAPVTGAQVLVRVEEPGMAGETKKLEPMVINNVASYGNYFRMRANTSYVITVRVKKTESGVPVEVRFEHRGG